MSANKTQIGGSHYKNDGDGEEHWDRVDRLNLNYFQACATKYIERCYLKDNAVQDLQKAAHFIQKLIELENVKHDEAEATEAYVNQDHPGQYKGDLRYKDPYDL